MSQQYLLPCECGQTTPVTTAQAGRTLACTCGRELRVPTLAGLRQLVPASKEEEPPTAAAWNPARGMLFVVGVVLALVGLVVGGYGSYALRQIDVQQYDKAFAEWEMEDVDQIERMTPEQTLQLWQEIQKHGLQGLGTAGSAFTVRAREAVQHYTTVAIAGFATAAVGILLAGASLVGAGRANPSAR